MLSTIDGDQEGLEASTFFVWGSSTVLTRRLISLRMALAATPVVAVLKSIWLVPRTRALKESGRGMRESWEDIVGDLVDEEGDEDGGGQSLRRILGNALDMVDVDGLGCVCGNELRR